MRPHLDAASGLRWLAGAGVAVLLAVLAGGPSAHATSWPGSGFDWYAGVLERLTSELQVQVSGLEVLVVGLDEQLDGVLDRVGASEPD